jgi:hypothetical protein
MPARILMVEVPMWQVLLAIVINVVVLIGIFKLAGKIYRIGILAYRQKTKMVRSFSLVKDDLTKYFCILKALLKFLEVLFPTQIKSIPKYLNRFLIFIV